MASGTIWMDSSKVWEGRVEWSATADTSRCCSHLLARAFTWKTDGYPTSGGGDFEGVLTVGSESAQFSFQQCDPEEAAYDVCIAELSTTIYHDANGQGSCLISCSITKGYSTSLAGVTCGGEEEVELDLIPRSSTLSCDGGTLGEEVELTIISESSMPDHIITYTCGSVSGKVCDLTWDRSISWTPPLDLAAQAPSGTSVSVKFTLEAYVGDTLVGTSASTVKFAIPEDICPSVSVETSDAKDYADTYGGYIQNRSALSVVLSASGVYGATIVSRQISFDDKVYTAARATTEVIKGSGTLQLVATVKDSRGRVGTTTLEVPVLAYEPPQIDNLTVQRCDVDGTRNKSGAYLIATFDAAVTALGGQNSASFKLQYKQSSASYYTAVDLEDLAGQFSMTGAEYIFEADPSYSYNVAITATDNFGSTQRSANGPSKSVFWSRMAKGLGFAFGKVAELAGHLDMGWHIYMNKNRIYGLPEPEADDEAVTLGYLAGIRKEIEKNIPTADSLKSVILNAAYPVGAIYISVNSTNPGNLFGGTWMQLKDRFLLGAGTSYPAGSTGGESEHTLTEDETPSHWHGGVRRYSVGSYPGTASTGASSGSDDSETHTDPAGGGKPHNNMPPYLAVYMWQRTA